MGQNVSLKNPGVMSTQPPIPLWHHAADDERKLESLLLNRVQNLDWYYFFFEESLDQVHPPSLSNLDQTPDHLLPVMELDQLLRSIQWQSTTDGNGYSLVFNPAMGASGSSGEDSAFEAFRSILLALRHQPGLGRNVLRRIFDSNEPSLPNKSTALEGMLGYFNRRTTKQRHKRYRKQINRGFRAKVDNVVILAEGDSWFQFPKIGPLKPVKDIVHHLNQRANFLVYPLAAGGDWLSNMLYTEEYIEALPRVAPDVLIFSGGGNDLVGGHRLASMLYPFHRVKADGDKDFSTDSEANLRRRLHALREKTLGSNPYEWERYRRGLRFLRPEFFLYLNHCFAQYYLLLLHLQHHQLYQEIAFITHGYDFGIPQDRNGTRWRNPLRFVVNHSLRTGRWLYEPMMRLGITQAEDQQAILFVIIHEFNEMLINLLRISPCGCIHYHVDCRGVTKGKTDPWFDELHPKSKIFKKVADGFAKVIQEQKRSSQAQGHHRIYRVAEGRFEDVERWGESF